VTVTRARRRPGPWIASAAATAVSTYALDGVATAAGVALVAAGLLAGLSQPLLLVILGVSYVGWFAGMRVNLAANWALLCRTGASTNVLSKAAYETAAPHRRRRAASVGYVLCELAKEIPYYAGAFGANLATDAVSTTDSLIFLAGTNAGAALYELGLARLTRAFLGREEAPGQVAARADARGIPLDREPMAGKGPGLSLAIGSRPAGAAHAIAHDACCPGTS
jgi:hypothetical protein